MADAIQPTIGNDPASMSFLTALFDPESVSQGISTGLQGAVAPLSAQPAAKSPIPTALHALFSPPPSTMLPSVMNPATPQPPPPALQPGNGATPGQSPLAPMGAGGQVTSIPAAPNAMGVNALSMLAPRTATPAPAPAPVPATVPDYSRTSVPTQSNPAGLPQTAPPLTTPAQSPLAALIAQPSSQPPTQDSPIQPDANPQPVAPQYEQAPDRPTATPAPQQKIGLGGILARLAAAAIGGSLAGTRGAEGAEEGVIGSQNDAYTQALNQWQQQQKSAETGYEDAVGQAKDRNTFNQDTYKQQTAQYDTSEKARESLQARQDALKVQGNNDENLRIGRADTDIQGYFKTDPIAAAHAAQTYANGETDPDKKAHFAQQVEWIKDGVASGEYPNLMLDKDKNIVAAAGEKGAQTAHLTAETQAVTDNDLMNTILKAGQQTDAPAQYAIIHAYNVNHPDAPLSHDIKYGPTFTAAATAALQSAQGKNLSSEESNRIVMQAVAKQNAAAHSSEAQSAATNAAAHSSEAQSAATNAGTNTRRLGDEEKGIIGKGTSGNGTGYTNNEIQNNIDKSNTTAQKLSGLWADHQSDIKNSTATATLPAAYGSWGEVAGALSSANQDIAKWQGIQNSAKSPSSGGGSSTGNGLPALNQRAGVYAATQGPNAGNYINTADQVAQTPKGWQVGTRLFAQPPLVFTRDDGTKLVVPTPANAQDMKTMSVREQQLFRISQIPKSQFTQTDSAYLTKLLNGH